MKTAFKLMIQEFVSNTDIADTTRALYIRVLNLFAQWVVKTRRNIQTLRRADIIAYKGSMAGIKSEKTIDNYLAVLKKFYSYCEEIGEHENIAAGIRVRIKDHTYKRAHLEEWEVAQLLNSIDRTTIIGKRDYAIINLLVRTGIRCIEASRLRIVDIKGQQDKKYLLLQRKGEMTRITKMGVSDVVLQPIYEYIEFRGVEDVNEPLFTTHGTRGKHCIDAMCMSIIIKNRMIKSGLDMTMKSAHSLRHTAAVTAIKMKVPIKDVQVMLGHASVKTTQLYLDSFEEDLRLSNPAVHALDVAFK